MKNFSKITIDKWDSDSLEYTVHYRLGGWSNRRNRDVLEVGSINSPKEIERIFRNGDTTIIAIKANTDAVLSLDIDGDIVEGDKSTSSEHELMHLGKGVELHGFTVNSADSSEEIADDSKEKAVEKKPKQATKSKKKSTKTKK